MRAFLGWIFRSGYEKIETKSEFDKKVKEGTEKFKQAQENRGAQGLVGVYEALAQYLKNNY